MLSGSGLSFGPHWLRGVQMFAEFLKVENVQIGGGVNQVHQSLSQFLVFVEIL